MVTLNPTLMKACTAFGPYIAGLTHEDKPVDGRKLLAAISGTESDFGKRREFVRMEKGYAPGGHYFSKSLEVRALWQRWGCLAASSFGSFQLMYVTTTEMGFNGHPIDLQDDMTCAYWATELINKRFIKRGAKTLRDILDSFNSGNFADTIIPAAYIAEGFEHYATEYNL